MRVGSTAKVALSIRGWPARVRGMLPTREGAFRLFRFAGIDVFLHWSWFLVAVIELQARSDTYSSYVWNGLEYLALFVIVTMHEFGHALACRSVGGHANQIVLAHLVGKTHLVADYAAERTAQLVSDALRHTPRGDAPRLGMRDHARQAALPCARGLPARQIAG